ncbi:hypothetical protein [Faecalibacterium prausnitzii]|nr:hypothetical protein [Faecalibacterium prausnitzii]
MCNSSWKNPNDLILVLRCTTLEFAKDLVNLGQIKFSTPKSWEQYGKQGRGDIYEGTLAYSSKFYPSQYEKLIAKYSNTCTYELPNRILIKNRRDMQLPCICFYGLKTDAFPPPQNEGRNRISTYIDAKYFRDFADNASPAEIAALPPKKQPAIAVIKDWAEFVRRLKAKLNSIGVPDECILVSPVQYFDFTPYSTDDSWVDLNCTPPKELFVKSKQDFEYQNELRIVIDTDDPTILDLLSNPIEIGNLSDIAAVAEGYHPEGIEVTATFNSYIIP